MYCFWKLKLFLLFALAVFAIVKFYALINDILEVSSAIRNAEFALIRDDRTFENFCDSAEFLEFVEKIEATWEGPKSQRDSFDKNLDERLNKRSLKIIEKSQKILRRFEDEKPKINVSIVIFSSDSKRLGIIRETWAKDIPAEHIRIGCGSGIDSFSK